MKTLHWALLLGSLGFAPATWAQDPPKAESESKKEAKPDDKGDAKPDEPAAPKRVEIFQKRADTIRAEKDVQAAKKAEARAEADAQRARSELQRAQGEAQRALQRAIINGQISRGDRLEPARAGNQLRRIQIFQRPGGFVSTFGLDFVPADPALRAQLELSPSEGLVVTEVVPDKPADKAGVKKNDVIVKIDGKSAHVMDEAQALIVLANKPSVALDLIRAGKPVALTLAKPEPPASKEPFYLGVVLAPVDATLRSQLPALPDEAGLVVTEVTPNSPAAKAEAKMFDIVVKLGDKPVKDNDALIEEVQKTKGEPISVQILRKGEFKTLTITPERRPAATGREYGAPLNVQGWQKVLDDPNSMGTYYINVPDGFKSVLGSTNFGTNRQPDELRDQLEKQLKETTKQVEELQKSIEADNKSRMEEVRRLIEASNKSRTEELQKAIEALNRNLERRAPAEPKEGKDKDEK